MLASQHCWILSDFFHSNCNITDGIYKEVGGSGGGWEGGVGVGGKPKAD